MSEGSINKAAPSAGGAPGGGAVRIVVFTSKLSDSVQRGIVDISRAMPDARWLVLLHAPRRRPTVVMRNQWRNLRRNGWRWIPYQGLEALRLLLTSLRKRAPSDVPHRRDWQSFLARPAVTLLRVDDINSSATVEQVRQFDADIGLSLAAPILRAPVFASPRLGTLNLHKGRVPDYRGMPPAFWELWNGESSAGCTVHWVDERLDTGDLVASGEVSCGKFTTLRGMQLQLDDLGVSMLTRVVVDLMAGHSTRTTQPPGGKTHRKPTLGQMAELRNRLLQRQPATQSRLRRTARDAVATLVHGFHRSGLWRVVSPRITVVLYHRVTDDARDNLSVGIEQFDRQMSLLAEHCTVLQLAEVLDCATVPRSRRPLVAVTFDDGYLDNYKHAVPILVRHGLPASFFVSTGLIGCNGRFPHDVRRGNPPIDTMTWQHLREMRDHGFHIGSHSVSHIDCASEGEQVVMTELARSRDDLRRELGTTDPVFAYPYGGRQHMTPQRLTMVKEVGYRGCLSAYGGSNVGRVDRFNVLRLGIHWEFSDKAFMLACLGLR